MTDREYEEYMRPYVERGTKAWRDIDVEKFIDLVRRGIEKPSKWVRLSNSTDPMPIIE